MTSKNDAGRPRNIGIFAHVDTGKTTLTEKLLVMTGYLRTAGSVDRGTACTDDLPVERRRGISVRAACVETRWQGCPLRLIDTPGHTDFSAEIERSFWALDGAVLLADAADGVRPQTEALFRALRQQGLPCLIFINKLDREGADAERTAAQISERLTPDTVRLWDPEEMTEKACEENDLLAEKYLEGRPVPKEEILKELTERTRQGRLFPLLKGSALRDTGVRELLDALIAFLPPPEEKNEGLCAVVFSSCADRVMGRGLWVRVFSGRLTNRMAVELPAGHDPLTGKEITVLKKITRLRGADGRDAESLECGGIGTVFGLGDTRIGTVLGNTAPLPRMVAAGSFNAPLVSVKVLPEREEDLPALRAACAALSLEDPLLHTEISPANEIRLHAMGKVQLEVLQEKLLGDFGLNASFSPPAVIYRETIAAPARGFVAYTMPKPCWAVLEFMLEPLPRGSGVSFTSLVQDRDILTRYQHQVEQALPAALRQGRLGWQVTDVKITLTGGNHHLIHTHPLDFVLATPMGIHDGLRRAGTVLLEPMLEVSFLVPAGCAGRVMNDVNLMRGETLEMSGDGETSRITARVPVSTSMDYSVTLAALTSGRGGMTARLCGYRECPAGEKHEFPRSGVDPLDTARYILAARSALEGSVYD